MSAEIRAATPAELRALAAAVGNALMFPPHDDAGWEQAAPSWLETSAFGAWDGDVCAGSASQFTVDTVVPGGARLPTGAVTRVGVLPTHRRQGIASALLHRLIDDAVERGLALMSLRASEAVIYERYGFGVAGESAAVTIRPDRAAPVRGAATDGAVRFVACDEVLATVLPIYERSLRRPGMVTRPEAWWRRYLADALVPTTTSHVVVHTDAAGAADGFAHYDVAWNDGEPGVGGGRGNVYDVFATEPAAELALWAYLFDIDLVREWHATQRPTDDVVRTAVFDRRAYRVTSVVDEQWLRVVDVDAALRARTYAATTHAVTIGVADPRVAANNGAWRVDADGAQRVDTIQTDPHVDLHVDIATLSAAYLGGTAWQSLAASGRVTARDPAAVLRADALFASVPRPFCGSFF